MIYPVDIHTHRLPQPPGTAIVNCFPDTFHPEAGGWYSVGIHPWRLPAAASVEEADSVFREALDRLSRLAAHPQVLAIGEAGMDKLATAPIEVQRKIFERQAQLAEETGKPLIVHLVKDVDGLMALKRQMRPSVPWIVHGFRGKALLAADYLRHGFYLSFGEKYQEEALRLMPADRLFIETDESTAPVANLYNRAAQIRGISSDELGRRMQENVGNVFFRR